MADLVKGYVWEFDVRLLDNRYMLWDFTRLCILTFFFVDALMVVVTGGDFEPFITLTGIGVLIFAGLYVLVSLLFFRNRIRTRYTLDSKGVGSRFTRSVSKINTMTIVLGALAGSPTVTGAGLLASSRESSFVSWDSVQKVTVDPTRRVISLHNGWRALQRLYCYPDNYETVHDFVKQHVSEDKFR